MSNMQKRKEIDDSPKCLMAVLAHPDDESFGMGGTLAWYASQGMEVRLVCATQGEVGEVDAELLQGFKSIADLRKHELSCAAKALGLTSVNYLGFRDSGMQDSLENQDPRSLYQAPLEEVAAKVVALMNQFQPHVVVTFDPSGGYLHPDHVKMNRATEMAFFSFQKKNKENNTHYFPQKLYFHTMPIGIFKYLVKMMPLFGLDPTQFGKNKDIDLTQVINREYPTHALISYRSVEKQRDQAAACHASQGGPRTTNPILRMMNHLFGKKDSYMRAYPPPIKGQVEKDLFAGLE
jgi:LmbE family N-acetylglucosaminyl deacetylase